VKYRLLIDSRVLKFLERLKRRDRQFLFDRFERICAHPSMHSDFRRPDETGRMLDCHVADRFAIVFWDDFADRHLKIMEVLWADRVG
jgi:hypothetical protein